METLKNHYDSLVKKYREVFVSVLSAIQDEIKNLPPQKIKSYLNEDLERLIGFQREIIAQRRENFNCGMCGACCKLAISEYSPNELRAKAQAGDKYANEFISTFDPYISENQAREQFPEYIDLINESGEKVYYYYCKRVTADNKCSVYENRPSICKDYPDNPLQLLHPTCAFSGWHESIQTVVLTIRAMKEIKNHFLKELENKKI